MGPMSDDISDALSQMTGGAAAEINNHVVRPLIDNRSLVSYDQAIPP